MPLVARSLRTRQPALACLFAAAVVFGVSVYFLHHTSRIESLEPFFDGLGNHSRKVTTDSRTAQRYFDQGLAFLYGFNYTEAARSFTAAVACDPKCPMAYWGVAIANGDAVSDPAADEPLAKAAVEAVAQAQDLAAGAAPVERDLIEALSHRYADPPPADPRPLDRAYAAAMRKVWKTYPDDGDVGALTGQALMLLHRKGSWTHEGEPQPGTDEVIQTLKTVLAKHPRHPYALHLLVHVVEASPHPEMGDQAADLLRDMAPGLGHLTHMPSHIDIRRGAGRKRLSPAKKR